jgi:hypothetical protein
MPIVTHNVAFLTEKMDIMTDNKTDVTKNDEFQN